MEGNAYSLADLRAATAGDGMFGGNGIWFLALLFLFGGGGFGWNRNGSPVTEADLCSSQSFNDLKSGVRDISGQISSMNVGLTKGLCDFGYTTLAQFNNLEQQLANCCCTTQRAIDSVKFDMANYSAATNAAIAANTQKVLDKMAADREAALNARIQSLELQQALCGVPRLLPGTMYGNCSCTPFNTCGCTNI